MAGWNDRSRGSSPQPPARGAYAREWRSGLAPRRRRTPKRLLIGGFGLVLAAVVGLIAYFLLLPATGSVPPSRLVLVGISAYEDRAFPPNAFARDDVAALHALQDANPRQFPPEEPWDDMLTGRTLLDQIGHKLGRMEGENLIVFCSLHAMVRPGDPGQTELYAIHADPDSPRSEQTDQMIPLPELLAALGRTSAQRIVLLLDVARLRPNWRLGVLAGDVAAQLEQDITRAKIDRLTVLCSAGPHEQSWAAPEWKQSAFGHYLVEALGGAADGWGERDADGHPRDKRVSINELYAYVHDNVTAWAREHRGVEQEVLRLGDSEDFPLVALPERNTVASAAETQSKPKKSGKKSSEKSSASSKQKKSESGSAGGRKKKKSESDGKKADPWERLFALWTERDELRAAGRVAGSAPHLWRRFQSYLLAAEQQLRSSLDDEADATLMLAGEMATRLRSSGVPLEMVDRGSPVPTLALASLVGADRIAPDMESKIQQYVQPLIAAGASPSKPADGQAPATGNPAAAPVAPIEPPAPDVLARWLIEQAIRDSRSQRLVELGFVLKAVDAGDWPAELVSLARLIERARVKPEPWSDASVSRLLRLRTRRYDASLADPAVLPLVEEDLRSGLRALDAAERWLMADGGANGRADEWLRRAEQAFEEADGVGRQMAHAVQLRDQLLIELPEVARRVARSAEQSAGRSTDWSRLRDVAAKFERLAELGGEYDAQFSSDVLSVWPAASGDQEQRERRLIELTLMARQLHDALEQPRSEPTETIERVNRLAADADRLWQEIRQDLQNEIAQIARRGQITVEDWRAADQLLHDPWIDGPQRRRLLELLKQQPRGGFYKPRDVARDERGLWQGFWAIQTLALAGAENDELARLWDGWNELLEAVTSPGEADPLRIRHRRSELGLEINRQWWRLAERGSRSADEEPAWPLLVRGIDGVDQPAPDPDRLVAEARRRQYGAFVGLHRLDWQRRQDQHPAFASITARGDRLLAELGSPVSHASETGPRLANVEPPVFRSDRTAELPIAVNSGSAAPQELKLLLQADRMEISRDGARVEAGQPIELSGSHAAFDLRLDESVVAPQPMLVALLGPDGFPWEIRPDIVFQPPFDPTQWRIAFQTTQGRPVHHEPTAGGTEIFLPPSGLVELKAALVRPAGDVTSAIEVAIYRRLPNGGREELIPKTAVELPPDKTRVELPLNLGGPEPPKAEAGGNTAPPRPAEPVGLAGGLIFELTPQGRETFTYLVQPEFWSAGTFVRTPQPVFEGDTLSVPVTRAAPQARGDEDWLLPEQIAVALEVPNELLSAARNRVLGSPEPSLGFDQERELSLVVDRARLPERFYEIKLNVAGLPHAYRWRVRADDRAVLLPGRPPLVRIASPQNRTVLKQEKDRLAIRLEVDASDLDLTGGEDQPWRLSYEIVRNDEGRRAGAGRSGFWMLRSSLNRQVNLVGLNGGVWRLSTSAGDYQQELETTGLSGRFVLLARLERGGTVAAEDEVEFAIDDEQPAKVNVMPRQKTYLRTRPVTVEVSAEDRQSGITGIAVGLDANGNGQIDQEERAFEEQFPAIDRPKFEDAVTIQPRQFPAMEGAYDVIAVAVNGVGTTATVKHRIVLQDPPKPPPAPKPTTGTIVLRLSNSRGKKSITLTGPTRRTETAESGQTTVRISDLQPGAYEINVRGYLKDGSAKGIQVKAGETTEVEVAVQ